MTLTISGFVPASEFRERTIALAIPITITSTVGTSVQMISSRVLPWIGGPSL